MTAGFNRSFGKKVIEMERHCADDDRMLRHQSDKFSVVPNVESSRVHHRCINGIRDLPGSCIVDVCKRDGVLGEELMMSNAMALPIEPAPSTRNGFRAGIIFPVTAGSSAAWIQQNVILKFRLFRCSRKAGQARRSVCRCPLQIFETASLMRDIFSSSKFLEANGWHRAFSNS